MRMILNGIVLTSLFVVVAAATGWASLAMFYRLPIPIAGRYVASGLFAVLGIITLVGLFCGWRWRSMAVFTLALAAILVWWSTITPSAIGNWSPDVSRQVTGSVVGDQLTLNGVRDFQWKTNDDFVADWATRTYDLRSLQSVDLFLSYWAGPQMAHVIMSFGFDGGQQLAWSIEVRRRVGGEFSPIADLFKSNPLVIIAADERDVVGVRSNIRGEDVQIYRLRMPPDAARALLLEYVAQANTLAREPRFYHSLFTNCTTAIVKMMRVAGVTLPLDWRLIVNGYLPDYIYDHQAVDTAVPLEDLRQASHIAGRAIDHGLSEGFSKAIRLGVPTPRKTDSPETRLP